MATKYKHVRQSGHPDISKGWYYGLVRDVHKSTGLSKPTITYALRNNDTSTSERHQAVACALKLIKERQEEVA